MAINTIYVTSVKKHQMDEIGFKISDDKDIIEKYLTDESSIIKGYADSVYYPYTEAHVNKIVRDANENKVRVTVSGGGTGITGSRVPLGGVVVSTEYMTQISTIGEDNWIEYREGGYTYVIKIGWDEEENTYYAVAPPGITLQTLDNILATRKLLYPPDPTEKMAFLGGTVATNASGSRSYYYGSTREYIRRLRIVLPTGETLDIKRGEYIIRNRVFRIESKIYGSIEIKLPKLKIPNVRKNAAGYYIKDNMDLIDLFIGSEGTLGVFTEIEVRLIPRPNIVIPLYIMFLSNEDSIDFVREMRVFEFKNVSNVHVLSLEYYDRYSVDFIRLRYGSIIPDDTSSIIYMEMDGDDEETLIEALQEIDDIIDYYRSNKVLASFDVDWIKLSSEIRHALPTGVNEFVRRHGTRKVATDIAVPDDSFDEMLEYYRIIGDETGVQYVLFGHIGDNHLHFNFLPRDDNELMKAYTGYSKLLLKAVELGGTVSAEHGVGKKKCIVDGDEVPLLELMYGKDGLIELAKLKHSFDPNHILNIGNIIPKDYLEGI